MFIQSSLVLPIHPFRSSDCIEVRLGTQAGPEGAEPGQIQAGLSRWEALSWQRAWPGMELARGCGGCLPHRAQSCRGVRPSGVRWWVLRCTGARLTLPGDCRGGGTGGTQEAAQESRGSPLPAGGIGPLGPTADRPATWRATCLLVMNDCSSLLTLLPTVATSSLPWRSVEAQAQKVTETSVLLSGPLLWWAFFREDGRGWRGPPMTKTGEGCGKTQGSLS